MSKAIINKHIDNVSELSSALFLSDKEKAKGEIIICNDVNNPSIYIMNTEGEFSKVAGGSSEGGGSDYDDTRIWEQVNKNTDDIKEIKENGVPGGIGSSVLTNDIVVAGLNGQFGAGNYSNNDIIPAGTDLEEIITNLLCKELYPTNVTSKTASASVSMSPLTLTLDCDSVVEVGTLVTLLNGNTNGTTVRTASSTINNMIYGYSYSDNDTKESTDTSITKDCISNILDNNYTISATIDYGFYADNENYIKTVPTEKSGSGIASLDETKIGCAIEGENKITLNATGASYSYSAESIDKVYYCSNLGNTDSEKYHNGIAEVSGTTIKPTTSKSVSVTGKYKYFLGYSTNTSFDQFDSDSVRALNEMSDFIDLDENYKMVILDSNTTLKSNGTSIVFACPIKYNLNTINNGVGANIIGNFSSVGNVSVKTGEVNREYRVYVYPITNNAEVEFKNVSLIYSPN